MACHPWAIYSLMVINARCAQWRQIGAQHCILAPDALGSRGQGKFPMAPWWWVAPCRSCVNDRAAGKKDARSQRPRHYVHNARRYARPQGAAGLMEAWQRSSRPVLARLCVGRAESVVRASATGAEITLWGRMSDAQRPRGAVYSVRRRARARGSVFSPPFSKGS